ncbi:hypothetical protein [Sorangium sp. So ce117]|uniref:hypothetical protein n=1 Tax=Sorangium sp. So ce117 TaxID=3133277 RepID=UPI003F5D8418
MLQQLRAREIAERASWAERAIPFSLRARALEFGLWGAEEAIERLRCVDFGSRHTFVLHHLGVFPDASLGAVLALIGRPQIGDGSGWFVDEGAVAAVAVRLARAGQHDAALDAIRALSARRGEALRSCASYLSAAEIARALPEFETWIPGAKPVVALLAWCDLLPLVPDRDRERARGEIVRLRAALGGRMAQAAMAAEERGATPPIEAAESRLGRLLFGPKHAAAIVTDRGFGRVLDFAEHHAAGDELALVMELARTLQGERRARLARALLQSGEELYDSPGFAELFSPEEQREHLRAALARYERPVSVEILYTLERAAQLTDGAPRGVLLSLYLDVVRARAGRVRLRGIFTAATLAEGDQRAALIEETLAAVEGGDNLDEEDRVEAIAAVLPLVPAERAAPLAGRVLDAVAEGHIGRTQAGDRLMAIPDPVWAMLPASRWEPGLRWALEEGAEFFEWTSWMQKTLPREVRAMLEAQVEAAPGAGAGAGDPAACPSDAPADGGGGGGELSPDERLRGWARVAVSLSEAERVASASEIEAAVRAILALVDVEDGVLCDTLASLPDAALRAIWSVRARADAWQRTIDISDPALFAYLPSEHYLHAEAVLQLILRLGGASALCDFARMLVGLQHESAA